MNKSIFSASKLSKLSAVAKGTKTTNDSRPELVTGRALNKFTLNSSAAELLNVEDGSYVTLFTLPDAEDFNSKFFIAKGTKDTKSAKLTSAGHKKGFMPLAFSYSSVWSLMIQLDINAKPLGERSLVEAGLMQYVPTQLGRKKEDGTQAMSYANLLPYTIGFGLELVTDEEGNNIPLEVDGITYEKVYVLTDYIKRDSKDTEESVEIDTEESVDETILSENKSKKSKKTEAVDFE